MNQWRKNFLASKLMVGVCLCIFLLASSFPARVQGPVPSSFEIPLKSGKIILGRGKFDVSGSKYVIVQLTRNLRLDERESLRNNGVNLLSFLYKNAWIAAVEPNALTSDLINKYAIAAAVPWQPESRATVELRQKQVPEWALTAQGEIKLLVVFFKDVGRKDIESLVSQYSSDYEVFSEPDIWAIEIAPDKIGALLQEPIVFYVEEGPYPQLPLLHDARSLLNVDTVQNADLTITPPIYNGLSGESVNLQVSEAVFGDHDDFWNHDNVGNRTTSRFINPPSAGGAVHGTHVAGIIGGNGWNSDKNNNGGTPYQFRGMAPEARLYNGRDFSGSHDIHASNHSYIMSAGEYDTNAVNVDRTIRGGSGVNLQWSQIWAAGNQGLRDRISESVDLDEEGHYSINAPAKNAIVIGSVNANDGILSQFSSLGPTFDGRIKPDVMAPGGKNLLPRAFEPLTNVSIDWIRLVYTPTGRIDMEWTFDTDGDLEGWFQTSDVYGLSDWHVSDGYLTFNAAVNGYGSNDQVHLLADSNHVIQMRYKNKNQGGVVDFKARLWWRVLGDPSHYINGRIDFDVKLDDDFKVVTIPVGQEGLEVDPNNPEDVIGSGGWKGTIDKLRIDPLHHLPSFGIVSTTKHQDGSYGYVQLTGTSMATPAVTGVVGLMLQQFVEKLGIDLDINPPLPSTVKAILIQTATDLVHDTADLRDPNNPDTNLPVLYHEGPDFATGYGLINTQAAVNFISNTASISVLPSLIHESKLDAKHIETFEIVVEDDNTGELKVTLVWDDVEASPLLSESVPHLVNDLDLVLIDPDKIEYYPWTLVPLPVADCDGAGPGCGDLDPIRPEDIVPASQGPDHRNNVEMVQVENPKTGKWLVRVRAHDLPVPLQAYSLASNLALANKTSEPPEPPPFPPPDIIVDTAEPNVNDDGFCSLVEAIINANDDAQTHADCLAGSGVDIIFLQAAGPYTLMVAMSPPLGGSDGPTGLPSITSEIIINSNKATIERSDLVSDFRIFHVAAGGDLTLNGVIVSNGRSDQGGGIFNRGMLSLINSIISGNDVNENSGGGIFNASNATLDLINSIVSSNFATNGGGIYNDGGTVTLTDNSTIIGNSTHHTTGNRRGGGIFNTSDGMITITNSTVFANSARGNGGGIYNDSGTVMLTDNSIISGNIADFPGDGGGIYNNSDGEVRLTNSIIGVNNLARFGGGVFNGGKVYLTNSTISNNKANNTGGGIYNDSGGELDLSNNSAINSNKVNHGGGGIYNNGGTVTLTDNSYVSGNGPSITTFSVRGGGIFNNSGTITLTNNSFVSTNSATTDGGGIFNRDTVNLRDSTISGNEADGNGGGFFNNTGGTVEVTNSTISNNSASGDGGGIFTTGGSTFELINSTISYNSATATGRGGGIFNGGTLRLTNSTVGRGNLAKDGGGIFNSGTMRLTNSTVSSNLAFDQGGGIFHRESDLARLLFSTISSNIADSGGGIFVGPFAAVELGGTILSKQISGGSCVGSITSFGYNLVSNITDCDFTPTTGDQWGTSDDPLDPIISYLQDNGGPTFTHGLLRTTDPAAPSQDSPAIDAILTGPLCPATDQRGAPRPADGNEDGTTACDIGAFERQEGETAIILLSFTAQAGADHVTLAWETGTEVDNAGFNLHRATDAGGPYTKLNDALIPAEGDPVSGASYVYTDNDVVKGVTYYYKLEDVDIHGVSAFHGPVSATPTTIRRIYLPVIVK